MILSNKPYKTLSVLSLTFQASPIYVMLYILLSVARALIPTIFMAIATANFIDTATDVVQGDLLRDEIYVPLIILLLVLGVFTTIGSVISLISMNIRIKFERKLKPAIIKVHSALDYKHIENAESWELISRVSRDPVQSIMSGFEGFMQMMQVILTIFSVFVLIIMQVWWVAFIITAFSAPMFWLSMYAGKKNYQAAREAEKFNRRIEYFEEVLTGRENVEERTIFSYTEEINSRWRKQYDAGRILKLKVNIRTFFITKGSSLVLALIGLLAVFTLINPVFTGLITAGMFMGIVNAVFGVINQIGTQFSSSLEEISKTREYMKDLTAFMRLSKTEDVLSEPDALPIEFRSLEFRNVRFKYPSSDKYILDGFSFTITNGRHYAFVGRNGAGKTTITKLLTGLYTEYSGEIMINGKELRTYPAGTLKALFSVMYQDFAKYYIQLKDNIAIGDVTRDGGKKEDDILNAVHLAGLDDTINKLKDGIDTPLGKIKGNGQDVSGGEWQRIAIARSILSRAPVKILDEPTSALDPIGESQVYGEFDKLMRGKTTIFISHRLGSTKLADEILVIDGGQIIERGTHDELIKANNQYAAMYNEQRSWYQ